MRGSRRRKGAAVLEFTLSLVVLVPLLLGTFIYGFRLVRSLDMQQIVGDLGHMYIKGVNFRSSGPISNAKILASGFDLSSTGTSLLIFSEIKVIQQSDCDLANPTKIGQPCTNLNKPVFMEQLTIGNSSLKVNGVTAGSSFGTPSPLQADFTVTSTDQANTATAQTGHTSNSASFSTVLALKPGENAYLVEMFNITPDLNVTGISGSPQIYARAIY